MEKFPVLQNELARLEKLYSYNILEMEPEDRFDDLTKLAASILEVPICLITVMDADWQAFISSVGTDMKGNHRELAFCKYCVVQENILEIQDTTKDDRVAQNPLVVNAPNLRYYVGAPLIDDEGLIIGTVCGYDLKPRQLTQFQLESLEQITATVMRLIHLRKVDLDQDKYKGIFNLSQDLLFILSKEGFLKEFNPLVGSLLGANRDDLLSKEFSNWVHPKDLDQYREVLQNSNETEIRTGLIFRLKKANNEFVTIEWSFYYDAELSILVVSGHDITEALLRQSELELAVTKANEAVQMKDQFLSDMSHEIRTPLSSIVGFNELLSTSDLTNEQKSYTEAVGVASEHMIHIVNDVLDVYKFGEHELTLDPAPENLDSILRKIKKLYDLKAASKQIELKLDFDSHIPKSLNIDRTRLTQIISNLVSNAIKFTESGSVTISAKIVSTSEEKATVGFAVADTGIGIDQSVQDSIFERFKQAEEATWKRYGGTGLGLSIAKQLVELHQSNLELKSTPQIGTTFSFDVTFSLSDLSSVPNSPSNSAPVKIPSMHGLKVMLAEDNKHLQILCKTFIERNEGEIHIVSNGQEAIDYLAQNEVDVILLDMQMPLVNGIEAAKHIREELKLTVPILGCSANLLDVEYTPEDLKYLDEFITKPYSEFRLISGIIEQFEAKTSSVIEDDFSEILQQLRVNEGDELINEFEKIFKSRIPHDIADLVKARKNRDYITIKNKAHFLTTTFVTLKFSQGLSLSNELQEAIEKDQKASALILTDRFIDYLSVALKTIK